MINIIAIIIKTSAGVAGSGPPISGPSVQLETSGFLLTENSTHILLD